MPQGQIPQIPSKAIFNQLVDDCDALGISQVMASSLDLIFSALSDPQGGKSSPCCWKMTWR